MTGHRRQEKPKRYDGQICYQWGNEYQTSFIENSTHDEIMYRVSTLLRKGVTGYMLNLHEVKVGKRK